ncbi:MAG TPA: ThuA domain-containing protein [Longimicrobiales bacterium]|nr:ThuA domain-containing protein [Longimicrobiales bacterium]
MARRVSSMAALLLAAAALVAPPLTLPASAVQAGAESDAADGTRKVVFIAGRRSHGYGAHEHFAGSTLLANLLNENHPGIEAVVYRNGWPEDPTAFDGADAVVIYADGGGGHPALQHLETLGALMDRGVGLVLLHYAVEVPAEAAGREFLDWAGGYFEINWSVNPHWVMQITEFPDHPVTRGIRPFTIDDEWYYHMRFRDGMEGVQPILTTLPPESSLSRPDGTHSGNPDVRAAVLERREPQHMAWVFEREDGGRAFGFTGGHWHWNWGHPMQRKLVLNAIAWAAGAEIPADGVDPGNVTWADLEANQDYEKPQNFDPAPWLPVLEGP